MIMIGPAIGYIIMGAAIYKYRSKLNMTPSAAAEYIGFSLWTGGWFALIVSIICQIAGTPEPFNWMGMVVVTLWVGSRGISVASQMSRNDE